MEDMIDWYELHYDADELIDVLQIEVEEIVAAFPDRCRDYMEGHPDAR